MKRFEVLHGDALIGWSELEFGDPPMGIAYGRFFPSDLYVSSVHAGPVIGLRVRPDGGRESFGSIAGVHIEDLSDDFGPEEIELSILGLESQTYARFFPYHVQCYEKQIRSR